jgi:hypothetical protein
MATAPSPVRDVREGLEPLWAGGLALAQIYLAWRLLPLRGEPYEWAQYLLLGVVFPLALLAVARTGAWLKCGLALVALAAGLALLPSGAGTRAQVLLLAGGQLLVLLAILWARRAPRPGLSALLVGGAVLTLGWGVAVRWLWWAPAASLTASGYTVAVTAAAGVLAAAAFTPAGPPTAAPRRWRAWLTSAPALAVLLVASLDLPPRGADPGASLPASVHHHWSAIVGPAALVRQGGWPLWDVPCQYGFLSTLTVAALPLGDAWRSFYALNTLLQFLAAAFLFVVLRSAGPGAASYAFALLAALAAVFLIPGVPGQLAGPLCTPAVGAFRFCWCYALLAVLVWDHRAAARGRAGRGPLWAGCVVWLIGTLWSAESAAYCLTIWLPALSLLALRRARLSHPAPAGWRPRARAVAAWLAVPPLLLGATLAVIALVYVVGLGHPPDWYAAVEFCTALPQLALPIQPQGPVWALLLVFVAVATAAVYCLRGPEPLRDAPLLTGAAAALWAASSYFVGRSHDINATNLSPIALAGVAVTLYVLARRPPAAWVGCVRLALLPLATVLLAAAFADRVLVGQYVGDLAHRAGTGLQARLPPADHELAELLTASGVGPDDPVVFIDHLGSLCPVWYGRDGDGRVRRHTLPRAWLPAAPSALFWLVSEDRRDVYFSRFVARARLSGWLIVPNDGSRSLVPGMTETELRLTHHPGRTLANARWRMTWYDYQGPAP